MQLVGRTAAAYVKPAGRLSNLVAAIAHSARLAGQPFQAVRIATRAQVGSLHVQVVSTANFARLGLLQSEVAIFARHAAVVAIPG